MQVLFDLVLSSLSHEAKATLKSKVPTGNMAHSKFHSQQPVPNSSLALSSSSPSSANKSKLHWGSSNLENKLSKLSSSNRKTAKSGTSLGLISQEEEKVALNVSQSGNLSQILDEEAYW